MIWKNELTKKIEMDGVLDEKNAGGVYDFAIEIAIAIEDVIGQRFDHKIDEVVDCIYDKIKYGKE